MRIYFDEVKHFLHINIYKVNANNYYIIKVVLAFIVHFNTISCSIKSF